VICLGPEAATVISRLAITAGKNWYASLRAGFPEGHWFTRRSWACSTMNLPTSGSGDTELSLESRACGATFALTALEAPGRVTD
jgi:hypothetical protein